MDKKSMRMCKCGRVKISSPYALEQYKKTKKFCDSCGKKYTFEEPLVTGIKVYLEGDDGDTCHSISIGELIELLKEHG